MRQAERFGGDKLPLQTAPGLLSQCRAAAVCRDAISFILSLILQQLARAFFFFFFLLSNKQK